MRLTTGILGLLLVATITPMAQAQNFEIHPYIGGFVPQKFLDLIQVQKEGIYGVKGGVFLTPRLEAEGHFGFINNLNFKETLTRKRAYLWEGAALYHLGPAQRLYVTAGVGRTTTTVSKDSGAFFSPETQTRDHFLALSYGGGLKLPRLWGTAGFRADLRGRTLPHYYGFSFSWLEATAGVTFSISRERSKPRD